MPKVDDTPAVLRPFLFHGLDLSPPNASGEALADCPFCGPGRKKSFSVKADTGQWRCFRCAEGTARGGGNVQTFLAKLLEHGTCPEDAARELAAGRGLLRWEGVLRAGLRLSPVTGEWLLPAYHPEGRLATLYRYTRAGLRATAGLPLGMFLVSGTDATEDAKPSVHVCEGPWDGLAWAEALAVTRAGDGGKYGLTGNPAVSILATTRVVAVPGAEAWASGWEKVCAGKDVTLLYDNDHPRVFPPGSGRVVPGAGWAGMRRVCGLLAAAGAEDKPASIKVLTWGRDGHDPELASGYDVRDVLKAAGDSAADRVAGVHHVTQRVDLAPAAWLGGAAMAGGKAGKPGDPRVPLQPCTEWRVLVNAFRKALRWTEGLDRGLSVMLASVASVRMPGDQLWVKVIAPPSGGKSVLCEALATCDEYVLSKSVVRGFHSGYQSDREGSEDNSLIPKLRDKTLVTKDGDTLLQQPNLGQILAEARDLYDTTSRTHYRNKASRDYANVRFTWLLCGTESLRQLDSSELGERFLDCVMMDVIDEDLEDEIGLRAVRRVYAGRGVEMNCKPGTGGDAPLAAAYALCGGYVQHLRRNAAKLLDAVELGADAEAQLLDLGKLVAYMRARPSKKQDEAVTREFSTRLRIQLARLALCLAVVLNKTEVDAEVLRRTARVAWDTARGRTLRVADVLYGKPLGAGSDAVALWVGEGDAKTRDLLAFMARIGTVERFTPEEPGMGRRVRWRLTARFRELMTRCRQFSNQEQGV